MAATFSHPSLAPPVPAPPAGGGSRVARACDALLTFSVLALAVWTLAYHVCLLSGLGVPWALAALAAGLVPCVWLAVRHGTAGASATAPAPASGGRAPLVPALAALALAVAAAASLARGGHAWTLLWAPWPVAAVVVLLVAARGSLVAGGPARAGRAEPVAALAWAAAMAVLALLLVKPNADDTYYLRQSAWIGEHGRFPLRDTLHSHDVLPAAFSPPLPSWEALLGSLAGAAGVSAPVLAQLVAAPLAAALAVLALWRLLRAWEVRMAGAALTVAMLFLVFAVETPQQPSAVIGHLPGDFFVARIWQGKVILVALLVPLLFALLHEYAARPARGGLLGLGAAGAAAVGLSTTATFLVPVIALACLAPLAARAPRRALAGMAAASAYPLAGMAAALLSDGRQPARWGPHDLAPQALVLPALGTGLLAVLAVTAAIAGPLLLAPRHARLGVAAATAAAALAFAPGVPQLIFDLTGLGRPLWRLMWAMPVAALVGVLAAQPAAAHRSAVVRLLPVAIVGAVVVLAGHPVWQGRNTGLAGHPSLKRDPAQLAVAERLSRAARPGDVVLAPEGLSATLLMLDGRVTAVAPRRLYTRALPATPAARRGQRLLLWAFANSGTVAPEGRVVPALRALGVDLACVREGAALRGTVRERPPVPASHRERLLARAGFRPLLRARGFWCASARDGA